MARRIRQIYSVRYEYSESEFLRILELFKKVYNQDLKDFENSSNFELVNNKWTTKESSSKISHYSPRTTRYAEDISRMILNYDAGLGSVGSQTTTLGRVFGDSHVISALDIALSSALSDQSNAVRSLRSHITAMDTLKRIVQSRGFAPAFSYGPDGMIKLEPTTTLAGSRAAKKAAEQELRRLRKAPLSISAVRNANAHASDIARVMDQILNAQSESDRIQHDAVTMSELYTHLNEARTRISDVGSEIGTYSEVVANNLLSKSKRAARARKARGRERFFSGIEQGLPLYKDEVSTGLIYGHGLVEVRGVHSAGTNIPEHLRRFTAKNATFVGKNTVVGLDEGVPKFKENALEVVPVGFASDDFISSLRLERSTSASSVIERKFSPVLKSVAATMEASIQKQVNKGWRQSGTEAEMAKVLQQTLESAHDHLLGRIRRGVDKSILSSDMSKLDDRTRRYLMGHTPAGKEGFGTKRLMEMGINLGKESTIEEQVYSMISGLMYGKKYESDLIKKMIQKLNNKRQTSPEARKLLESLESLIGDTSKGVTRSMVSGFAGSAGMGAFGTRGVFSSFVRQKWDQQIAADAIRRSIENGILNPASESPSRLLGQIVGSDDVDIAGADALQRELTSILRRTQNARGDIGRITAKSRAAMFEISKREQALVGLDERLAGIQFPSYEDVLSESLQTAWEDSLTGSEKAAYEAFRRLRMRVGYMPGSRPAVAMDRRQAEYQRMRDEYLQANRPEIEEMAQETFEARSRIALAAASEELEDIEAGRRIHTSAIERARKKQESQASALESVQAYLERLQAQEADVRRRMSSTLITGVSDAQASVSNTVGRTLTPRQLREAGLVLPGFGDISRAGDKYQTMSAIIGSSDSMVLHDPKSGKRFSVGFDLDAISSLDEASTLPDVITGTLRFAPEQQEDLIAHFLMSRDESLPYDHALMLARDYARRGWSEQGIELRWRSLSGPDPSQMTDAQLIERSNILGIKKAQARINQGKREEVIGEILGREKKALSDKFFPEVRARVALRWTGDENSSIVMQAKQEADQLAESTLSALYDDPNLGYWEFSVPTEASSKVVNIGRIANPNEFYQRMSGIGGSTRTTDRNLANMEIISNRFKGPISRTGTRINPDIVPADIAGYQSILDDIVSRVGEDDWGHIQKLSQIIGERGIDLDSVGVQGLEQSLFDSFLEAGSTMDDDPFSFSPETGFHIPVSSSGESAMLRGPLRGESFFNWDGQRLRVSDLMNQAVVMRRLESDLGEEARTLSGTSSEEIVGVLSRGIRDYFDNVLMSESAWRGLGTQRQSQYLDWLSSSGQNTSKLPSFIGEALASHSATRTAAASEVVTEVAHEAPRSIPFSSVLENFKTSKSLRYGAYAIAGGMALGVIRTIRKKDHTEDDITGPGYLPGGNPYSSPMTSSAGASPYGYTMSPGVGGGMTYRVNGRGSSGSMSGFQSDASNIVGGSSSGTIYNTLGSFAKGPLRPQVLENVFGVY